MRLVVLTTDTLHHLRFVQEIARHVAVAHILEETTGIKPPFDTAHPFEAEREDYERSLWFPGGTPALSDVAPVSRFANLNEAAAVEKLAGLAPDLTVVFGTRPLSGAVIDAAGPRALNLHGGDPEAYRGLDTHLWAIYHGDFANLITALHVLDRGIDDGAIVATLPLALERDMTLKQLRAANTAVCIALVRQAVEALSETGRIVTRPQRAKGRYYSFMPAVLKEICVGKFAKHTGSLA